MNHIARHVYARRDFEQAQRALNRQKKFEAWQAELAKESCSDSDGDAGGELGAEWVERRNLDGGLVWVHNETGEIVTVDPRTDPVDAELIGCSVRVFCRSRSSGSKGCWLGSIAADGNTGSSTSTATTSGSTWMRRPNDNIIRIINK